MKQTLGPERGVRFGREARLPAALNDAKIAAVHGLEEKLPRRCSGLLRAHQYSKSFVLKVAVTRIRKNAVHLLGLP